MYATWLKSPITKLQIYKTMFQATIQAKQIQKAVLKNLHTCICGQTYMHNRISRSYELLDVRYKPLTVRLHSTQSDQRRQKVVLEATPPKIVIEKIDLVEKDLSCDKSEVVKDNIVKDKLVIWKSTVDPYIKLMRLDKPIGIWLLFWPCSWSIALGAIHSGAPLNEVANTLSLFFVGATLMRAAGCTINDLWDRDIDARVERTKDRPLVSGAITEKQAVMFLAAQLTGGLAVLLQLNWYSILLGASSMALVVTYPLAKRFTRYPQLYLGATFNWGALLGYSAVVGSVAPAVCLPLYAGCIAWTVMYDTIYAHQDKVDDARIGIKSTALTFNEHTKPFLWSMAAASTGLLSLAGYSLSLQWPHYAAVAAAASHAAAQIHTLKPDCPEDCARKFKSNTWIGLIVLIGITAGGYHQYAQRRDEKRMLDTTY